MKKGLLKAIGVMAAVCLGSTNVNATVHNITVSDFQFAPSTLTVQLGDTIMWTHAGGVHTTTSNTIPSGAAAWNEDLTLTSPTFTYVPTVAGTYNYHCAPHQSMGMTGSFTVTTPSSVPPNVLTGFSVAPNPARSVLNVRADVNVTLSVIDASGRLTTLRQLGHNAGKRTYSLDNIASGLYLLMIRSEDRFAVQKLLVDK